MTCKFTKSILGASIALSIGLILPDIALAETAPEEIIVTARRREERLQDVPISITVFSQQQLTSRNVSSGSDLANYTPSLSSNERFGSDNASFAIRGFTQELRTTASVAVYFADVVAPRAGQNSITAGDGAGPGDFFDLQNVQVLKGPQGTLFGRNTTGGAILLVPKKPGYKFGGYFEASLGNFDMKRFQGVLNVPLNDKLRLRVGFDRQTRDGYLNNESGIGPRDQGRIDYTTGRVSLVADLTDRLQNYTVFTITNSSGSPAPESLFACKPSAAGGFASFCNAQLARQSKDFYTIGAVITNPKSDIDSWRVINTTTWDATDNFTIKNIFAYSELKTALTSPVFAHDFRVGGVPFVFSSSQQIPGYPSTNQVNYVEELQFQGKALDKKLDWQGGIYFEKSLPATLAGSLAFSGVNCTDAQVSVDFAYQCRDVLASGRAALNRQLGKLSFENKAVYVQATYQILDSLRFTGGARYTWDETNSSGSSTLFGGFPAGVGGGLFTTTRCVVTTASLAAGCWVDQKQRSHAPTWLLDIDYFPVRDIMIYAKYARGYRQGAINLFGAQGFQTYDPERVNAYEIGAKTSFSGKVRGTFDIAGFYNQLAKQQLQEGLNSLVTNPTTAIINAGASTIWGIEIESHVVPARGLSFDIGYTYLATKVDKLDPFSVPPESVYLNPPVPSAVQGAPLPLSPMNKASFTATYEFPLPNTVGHVALSGNYTFQSHQIASAGTPFGYLTGYGLLNFNLDWRNIAGSPIDASLFVTNALDDEYETFVAGFWNSLGVEFHNVGTPRMFGGRLRYSFGGEKAE